MADSLPMPPPKLPFSLGAGASALRRTVEVDKKRFTMTDLSPNEERWKKSLTERMREVDELRMRAPVEEECAELNIPESRLNLHSLQNVLLLCGGCVGVRFAGDDLQAIISLTSTCETQFLKMDAMFKVLPSSSKNRRLQGPYETNSTSSGTSCTHPDDLAAGAETADIAAVLHQIDGYLGMMRQLQHMVRSKNETMPSAEDRAKYQRYGKDPDAIEGAASQPQWLSVLVTKYNTATGADDDSASATAGAGHGKVTLGKLAAFLSCIAMGLFSCTSEEQEGFLVLLHASNDSKYSFSLECDNPRSFVDRVVRSSSSPVQCQQYIASRFFNFLRTLTELKSMPEDEKSLHQFNFRR